jgi:hypothetical protein
VVGTKSQTLLLVLIGFREANGTRVAGFSMSLSRVGHEPNQAMVDAQFKLLMERARPLAD